ncbi:MAG: nitroreductase family protein [Deltaproteobacteria bacterium]|nr:nitroreductase family protein [Deltaproteobacteria bacterium]
MIARNGQRWLEAAARRVSRRRFEAAPRADSTLRRLEELCESLRPFGSARVLLVREAPAGLFRGIVGASGSVRGAPHCLVMVGAEDAAAEVGYVGEAAVLEATALGLGTCWVGGLFSREKADSLAALGPAERAFAVSPLGRATADNELEERLMSAVARSRSRKPLSVIAPGSGEWPAWARAGVEAARLAPSALNRQPWRFSMEGGTVLVAADSDRDTYRIPKRLDCGIAMLHFELGARGAGVPGAWRDAAGRVAAFVPASR